MKISEQPRLVRGCTSVRVANLGGVDGPQQKRVMYTTRCMFGSVLNFRWAANSARMGGSENVLLQMSWRSFRE
jgi:hypothetical protein